MWNTTVYYNLIQLCRLLYKQESFIVKDNVSVLLGLVQYLQFLAGSFDYNQLPSRTV